MASQRGLEAEHGPCGQCSYDHCRHQVVVAYAGEDVTGGPCARIAGGCLELWWKMKERGMKGDVKFLNDLPAFRRCHRRQTFHVVPRRPRMPPTPSLMPQLLAQFLSIFREIHVCTRLRSWIFDLVAVELLILSSEGLWGNVSDFVKYYSPLNT